MNPVICLDERLYRVALGKLGLLSEGAEIISLLEESRAQSTERLKEELESLRARIAELEGGTENGTSA